MAQTIVLGYDGSEGANKALDVAVSLARRVPDGKVIVANGLGVRRVCGDQSGDEQAAGEQASSAAPHILDRDGLTPFIGPPSSVELEFPIPFLGPWSTVELEDLTRYADTHIRPVLEEASARITAAGVPAESKLEWGAPSATLLDIARRSDAFLIVVGTHGTGAADEEPTLGSTPTTLLNEGDIPVVVVP